MGLIDYSNPRNVIISALSIGIIGLHAYNTLFTEKPETRVIERMPEAKGFDVTTAAMRDSSPYLIQLGIFRYDSVFYSCSLLGADTNKDGLIDQKDILHMSHENMKFNEHHERLNSFSLEDLTNLASKTAREGRIIPKD